MHEELQKIESLVDHKRRSFTDYSQAFQELKRLCDLLNGHLIDDKDFINSFAAFLKSLPFNIWEWHLSLAEMAIRDSDDEDEDEEDLENGGLMGIFHVDDVNFFSHIFHFSAPPGVYEKVLNYAIRFGAIWITWYILNAIRQSLVTGERGDLGLPDIVRVKILMRWISGCEKNVEFLSYEYFNGVLEAFSRKPFIRSHKVAEEWQKNCFTCTQLIKKLQYMGDRGKKIRDHWFFTEIIAPLIFNHKDN